MIRGEVSSDGQPRVFLTVDGRDWPALISEAMSGLERLPEEQAGQWLRVAWYLVLLVFHRREEGEYTGLQELVREQARQSKFRVEQEVARMATMAERVREEGRAEGEARGRAEGEARGLRQAVAIALQDRFGPLPPDTAAAVASADVETLRGWLRAALSAKTLDEVRIREDADGE